MMAPSAAISRQLVVTINRLGSTTLQKGRPLVVHGSVTNPSPVAWLQVQAYLQISFDPATTLAGLEGFADVPATTGLGNPDLSPGEYAGLGTLRPGQSSNFVVRIPYAHLVISGAPGVYRLGLKVLATTPEGLRDATDAARANTLVALLPAKVAALKPVEAVTLLPLTAPVKRLTGGTFAEDSLVGPLSAGGRLSNVVDWALNAAPETVQVVIDPALLSAVGDMSDGYRVSGHPATSAPVAGRGQAAAARWLTDFQLLAGRQHVMLLPWGEPAVNSLLADDLPGPVTAAVAASHDFRTPKGVGSGVVGWLPDGGSGTRAVTVMHRAGASMEIVTQASLVRLAADQQPAHPPLSRLDIVVGRQRIPSLVVASTLAGLPTTVHTSPLQLRQRLLAEATTRSLNRQTHRVAVTALPFSWDPGPVVRGQELASAFASPVLVGQSALGALDRPGAVYDGPLRPGPGSSPQLSAATVTAIRDLRLFGGNLAAILSPSIVATQAFQRGLAMSGSAEWLASPRLGATLIGRLATADHNALAKVTVTGPPFVAMSSDSGRFPLTVTNDLDKTVSVGLAVTPDDPALSIGPLQQISLPPGQRRDVQVVSTAAGAGVTSVRARLTTLAGRQFGTPWRFDVRATQIGLVIWIVMGAGGVVLFSAAGYRIVNRLRGHGSPRRQAPA